MDTILREAPYEAPQILIDEETGHFEITGKSTLPDPEQFYENLAHQIELLSLANHKSLTFNFRLTYLNTGSSKWIWYLLRRIDCLHQQGNNVIINWYYEYDDEVINEAGEDYMSLLTAPFNLVETN